MLGLIIQIHTQSYSFRVNLFLAALHSQVFQCWCHELYLRAKISLFLCDTHTHMKGAEIRWITQQRGRERGGKVDSEQHYCRGKVEGWLKDIWSPGKTHCLCLSQHVSQKKKKKQKKKAHELHHRRRCDSVVYCLSPPTFARCKTTSRLCTLSERTHCPLLKVETFPGKRVK